MKKRLMSLLLVCSMILSLFTGLSVTALAAGTGPAAATPTPTVASAFESSNGEITGFDFSVENVVIPASINGVTVTKIGQSAFLYTGLDSSLREQLVQNLGLSLSDHYWIRPNGSELTWKDVSLFSNSSA